VSHYVKTYLKAKEEEYMETQIFHHHAKTRPNLQNPKTLARSHQNQVIKQTLKSKI
jgi:hypothetical protein